MINELKPNQIFVVGTNYRGEHAAGAALYAEQHFGLQHGCAHGLSGQTYGIVTMANLSRISDYIRTFIEFARFNPDKEFLLTPIGTGIAGYPAQEIAIFFHPPFCMELPFNIVLPEEFQEVKA